MNGPLAELPTSPKILCVYWLRINFIKSKSQADKVKGGRT